MMKKSSVNIDTFLTEFSKNLPSYGKLIKRLIQQTNRPFINLPYIGIARKIAKNLRAEPFSLYYIFERTLSHKLHPFLYNNNLNFLSNSWIEKQFYEKYRMYENSIPVKMESMRSNDFSSSFRNLKALQSMIMRMVEHDGHFMVIKFFDFIYSKIDAFSCRPFRSIEFSMNMMKKNLKDDKNENLEYIRHRFEKYLNLYGKQLDELFIERMRWDNVLAEYADKLKEKTPPGNEKKDVDNIISDDFIDQIDKLASQPEEEIVGSEEEMTESTAEPDEEQQMINKYAKKIKDDYLQNMGDDQDRLVKLVDGLIESNKKNVGIEKAMEIVQSIIESWLNDPGMSETTKALLREILLNKFNITALEPDELKEFDIADFSEEDDLVQGVQTVAEEPDDSFETAIPAEGTDNQAEQPGFGIEELEENELETFDISEEQETDLTKEIQSRGDNENIDGLTEFNTAPAGQDENGHINIENNVEELDETDLEIKKLLEAKQKRLQEIERKLSEEENKCNAEYGALQEETENNIINKLVMLLNNEMYQSRREDILDRLAAFAAENLFVKIIHYLETGPFPGMTVQEKKQTIDLFIDKYRNNPKLVSQLENYKKTIGDVSELLSIIYKKLNEIEKKYPGIITCINQQLAYLEKTLNNEDYKPVWPTVYTIYKNILAQQRKSLQEELIRQLDDFPPWKKIQMLRYFQTAHRDNKQFNKDIESFYETGGMKPFLNRVHKEEAGAEVNIYKVLEAVTGEKIVPSQWMDSIVNREVPVPAAKDESDNITENATEAVPGKLFQSTQECDWSDKAQAEQTTAMIKDTIEEDLSSAFKELERIYSAIETDQITRDAIMDVYQSIEKEPYKQAYSLHSAIDAAESIEEKERILQSYEEKTGTVLARAIAAESNIIKQVKTEQADSRTIHDLLELNQDKVKALEDMSKAGNLSKRVRETAASVSRACSRSSFDEAFDAICSAPQSPKIKITFLETLLNIAMSREWITDDPDDKNSQQRKKKINNKIAFYSRFLDAKDKKRQQVREKNAGKLSAGGSKQKIKPAEEKKHKAPPRKEKTEDQEVEREDMSNDEKIYIRSLNIIKAFTDNIDALLPAASQLVSINKKDFKEKIDSRIKTLQQNKKYLIDKGIKMIKTSSPDINVINAVHKSSAKTQYLWEREILKKTGNKTIEEAFKAFDSNKELMQEITRIGRIIKSNNKNDFLKMMIDKETKLISSILKDLSVKNLRALKMKTTSRQDKDKLNLFRDLLRLTGDLGNVQDKKAENTEIRHEQIKKKVISEPQNHNEKKEVKFIVKEEDAYIRKVSSNVETFIKFARSERTRNLAVKNDERLAVIDSFFNELSRDDKNAVKYSVYNKSEFIELFTTIVQHKFQQSFPSIGPALKFALAKGLIKKEDLQ